MQPAFHNPNGHAHLSKTNDCFYESVCSRGTLVSIDGFKGPKMLSSEVDMTKKKIGRDIIQYLGIILGAIPFGIGYSWFLVPYKIAPGGVGGLSEIFFHLFHIPAGVAMIIMNIPLFILSFIYMGKNFGFRSIYGMLLGAVMVDLVDLRNLHNWGIIPSLEPYTFVQNGETIYSLLGPSDIYLAAIAGSVLLGIGLGVIFRFKGSTGGTDIPVALIKQRTGLSIGTGYWFVESVIIFTIGLAFQDFKLIIWGYINLFITAKITDLTSEGLPYVKGVYIVSDLYDQIKMEIFAQINRGVTLYKAEAGYSGRETKVIFCALNRRQVAQLRDIVRDIDPKAFMILTDVSDVMGLGFKTRQLDLSDSNVQ
jgi:uncharacterized membrane-anchored protein YitT (DUF2179 family)